MEKRISDIICGMQAYLKEGNRSCALNLIVAAILCVVTAAGARAETVDCADWTAVKSALEAGNSARLTTDITWDGKSVRLDGGQSVSLDLNGYDIHIQPPVAGLSYTAFVIESAQLELKGDGSIIGYKSYWLTDLRLADIDNSGSALILTDGVVITNFNSNVSSSAIEVGSGGAFTMTGGKIVGCTAPLSGGAVNVNGGSCNIYGGTIAGNNAAGGGGAIALTAGEATVYGGVFSGNTHGGLSDTNALFRCDGGTMKVYGGIYDVNPVTASSEHPPQFMYEPTAFDSMFVLGTNVLLSSDNAFIRGTFTFNPTNELYAACGFTLGEEIVVYEHETDPKTWSLGEKTLQYYIDQTPVNGYCAVPAGVYSCATVGTEKAGIRLEGVSEQTIIDTDGKAVGLMVEADNVKISGFTFRNCAGGAQLTKTSGTVSNCVFTSCYGYKGGGLNGGFDVYDCTFDSCSAQVDGGAIYNVRSARYCRFENCEVSRYGGAAYCSTNIFGSIFIGNQASNSGGGCYNCEGVASCTFAANKALNYSDRGGLYATQKEEKYIPLNCIFYNSTYILGNSYEHYSEYYNHIVYDTAFANAADGDYHLKISSRDNDLYGRTSEAEQFLADGTVDIEGTPFARTGLSGKIQFYSGCYAAFALDEYPALVRRTDDGDGSDSTNLTLRGAIELVQNYPDSYVTQAGGCEIGFADNVFGSDGKAVLTLTSAGIDLQNFTNCTLVIRASAGRRVVIQAEDQHRAFRVRSGNRLTLTGIDFRNCLGSAYGKSPRPGCGGAAILNNGVLMATDCTFTDCHAGNTYTKNAVSYDPTGMGGAILNQESGTATVTRCTFTSNKGALGGAFANQGKATIANSKFTDNLAQGTCGGRSSLGGAAFSANDEITIAHCTFSGNYAANASNDVYGATKIVTSSGAVSYAPLASLVSSIAASGGLSSAMTVTPSENESDPAAALARVSSALTASGADWFTVSTDGATLTAELNEAAAPTIDSDSVFTVDGDGDTVSLMPGNVKPGLFYGLGVSDNPAGPYTVAEDGWLQADADGNLPAALTAPKLGAGGFYRVMVKE